MKKVAIVILNYNGRGYLEKFLPSVVNSNYPNLEVVVADNGSTDDSLVFLKNTYPSKTIKVIALPQNYGFAEGYNQALKEVQADYYAILNSDVEVTAEWLNPIIAAMDSDTTIGACQPKIRAYHTPTSFEYAGAAGGWIDALGYPFSRGRIFDTLEQDNGQYDTPQAIFWASGAALLIRSEAYHNLGGFDGDFFAHMEEIDLCWRLQRAGYSLWCIPQSVVYHVGGGTLDYLNPRKTYLNFRNSLFTLLKNETTLKLLWLIPVRLVLDGLAGAMFLTKGQFSHILAIVKAHFSFYGSFFKYIQKRKQYNDLIQNSSIGKPPKGGYLPKSIVWLYQIKGKKHYNELF